ncbi:MAG: cytoplasmic protein [Deltaproteobacteria bacterium]|nr:cytoplasmic protein [Deltaproteobacteria bacterium]
MTDDQQNNLEFKINRSNLYHEESFTDLKVGTVKRLTPVKADGSADKSRRTIFVGHTSILTPNGPLPIQNGIGAKDLQQAIKKFPEAMQEAMERLMEEVKKYQEQEQSQIQKPDSRIIVP